ncbi:putative serine/threonine-protein kinase haspin [Septoria linicola]|nr:putative serine/threonine-protein kinase haspin [Septoria linicola]
MPGVKTYGKRSRAVYDARLAFSPSSSPDQQPLTQPLKVEKVKPVTLRKCKLVQDGDEESEVKTSPRRVLGERHVNSVVLPLEAVDAARDISRTKPQVRRKAVHNGNMAVEKKEDAAAERPARQGRHTFFDDEDLDSMAQNDKIPPAPEQSCPIPQPRRSPRKHKPTRKLIPVIPRHDSALGGLQEAESVEDRCVSPVLVSQDSHPQAACSYTQHCAELLNLSSHPLTDFAVWSQEISEHFTVTKIAEASFGEVYRLSLLEDISDFCSTDESVFKVIPLTPALDALPLDKRRRAAALKRAEGMTSPHDVATEVKLLQRMSSVPGFTNFRDIRILQGRPPPAFIDAFRSWNTAQKAVKKELSHFPDPAKKTSYNADQMWAVIEMQDAGSDLERLVESGSCTSIFPIWDIFWHTVLSIAKGEEGAEFEHRDLHLGNICVRSAQLLPEQIDTKRKLNFTSLETTIIDYTLSRCLMLPSDLNKPTIAYTDLSTPSQAALFEGDSTEEYQYDIYRYMRGALYFDQPLYPCHEASTSDFEATGRNWEQFHPQTNLVWLHLVLYKLLEQIEWPSAKKAPPKKKKPEEFAVWKRSNDLEFVLLRVQDLLDPDAICGESGIRSATDLIAFAVGEGWLGVGDVIGEVDESALISQLEGLDLQ